MNHPLFTVQIAKVKGLLSRCYKKGEVCPSPEITIFIVIGVNKILHVHAVLDSASNVVQIRL